MLQNAADHSLDFHLLNDFQRNFPLCPAPFAELAVKLGVAESTVLRMLEQLRREGKIARVGAVFAPKRIGASTLAAMAVAPDKLAAVAEAISRYPEVNHGLRREHRYNLWFIVTAGSEGRLQAALGAIEQTAGCPALRLPLLKDYALAPPPGASLSAPSVLDEIGRRLVMALQEGLPLFIRPFSVLASRVGCDEGEVLERIRRWCAEGSIKRFGVVVRDPAPAAGVQALLVHDIPDLETARLGSLLASAPEISLCYQRPRVLPDWPYNLFCAIEGGAREEVTAKTAEIRRRLDLTSYAYEILFTLFRFGTNGEVSA